MACLLRFPCLIVRSQRLPPLQMGLGLVPWRPSPRRPRLLSASHPVPQTAPRPAATPQSTSSPASPIRPTPRPDRPSASPPETPYRRTPADCRPPASGVASGASRLLGRLRGVAESLRCVLERFKVRGANSTCISTQLDRSVPINNANSRQYLKQYPIVESPEKTRVKSTSAVPSTYRICAGVWMVF